MIRIGDTIFSLDILEKRFCCDLPECLGSCCRYGDSGAPLTAEEVLILDKIWPEVKPFMRPEGINEVERSGTSVRDFENETVTPLINNEECAYAIFEGNIFMCAIERAYTERRIDFRKPLSCHLFPVRIKQFSGFMAVNYQELSICSPARECGKKNGVPLYRFLKEPLIRALGEQTWKELAVAAEELKKG